ncbi:MAG: hypothetical protein Kow0092_30740 [Deferrisomatales bacterium]
MVAIPFRTERYESRLLDPAGDGGPRSAPVEVRWDPLTGRTVHLSHFGAVSPQPLDLAAYETPQVRGHCPFCPPGREQETPRFPPDLLPEGRLRRGEALLFPNLYPYDAYGAVVVLTHEHVVPLGRLGGRRLEDALGLGLAFLERTRRVAEDHPYPLMAWNYMPPSGGGLVHPHQQWFRMKHPGNLYVEQARACRRFRQRWGREYWAALAEAEAQQGERFVATLGTGQWLSAFAPLGLLGEVLAVFPGVFTPSQFARACVTDLVAGADRVFLYFENRGIHSFNAALFLAPEGDAAFSAHLRIVPRTFLNLRDYATDWNFFQTLLQEPVGTVWPEALCRELRAYFS